MASAALAQSSYRIAKSWQYQEKLPDAYLQKDLHKDSHDITECQPDGNGQGNQIEL